MVSLIAKPPIVVEPIVVAETELRAVHPGPLTSLAGQTEALAASLEAAYGLSLPEPNQSTANEDVRCIWFGHQHWLLVGGTPSADLAAATTDQSDAWAAFELAGPLAQEALARLTPLDLRDRSMAEGATARSLLGHMNASLTRTRDNGYLILVFRSMARTAWHDLATALRGVAAQQD